MRDALIVLAVAVVGLAVFYRDKIRSFLRKAKVRFYDTDA